MYWGPEWILAADVQLPAVRPVQAHWDGPSGSSGGGAMQGVGRFCTSAEGVITKDEVTTQADRK